MKIIDLMAWYSGACPSLYVSPPKRGHVRVKCHTISDDYIFSLHLVLWVSLVCSLIWILLRFFFSAFIPLFCPFPPVCSHLSCPYLSSCCYVDSIHLPVLLPLLIFSSRLRAFCSSLASEHGSQALPCLIIKGRVRERQSFCILLH